MRYFDDYQELYHSEENWYFEYVNEELKRIRRRYNESERVTKKGK